jgi:hypothetical protein
MGITAEILRSLIAPRQAIRRQLPSITEGRALTYLLAACLLLIVAQAPLQSRLAHFQPEAPFEARMLATALGILAVVPAFCYALAALSHLAGRIFGGRGSWLGARLALFWTMLAMAPLFLLNGLVAGMIGPGPQANVVGVILITAFFAHWVLALAEAERGLISG